MLNDLKKIKKLFLGNVFYKITKRGQKSYSNPCIEKHELYLPGKGSVILKYSEILIYRSQILVLHFLSLLSMFLCLLSQLHQAKICPNSNGVHLMFLFYKLASVDSVFTASFASLCYP